MKNRKNSVTTARGKPESRCEKQKVIYSLGSSVRGKDEFIRILKDFGIKKLADVRRFPVSRFDYFGKDKLCSFLKKNAVEYLYLGDKLGGFRQGGYQQYINTGDFLTGLEELKSVASMRKTAFMCAERFPWRCHRRFIAQVLEKQGWTVIHIIDEGKTWEAKPKNLTQKKKSKPLSLPI
jgi:uncharacterized protein (DUF488 family)